MVRKLIPIWKTIDPYEIAQKVKRFHIYYAINRHKSTTLTPSFHAEAHSNDDNRFDLRQFLYNCNWPWQFNKIDEYINNYKK